MSAAQDIPENPIVAEIEALLPKAREAMARVGPMHSNWDILMDYDALMAGRETILKGTRIEILLAIRDALK